MDTLFPAAAAPCGGKKDKMQEAIRKSETRKDTPSVDGLQPSTKEAVSTSHLVSENGRLDRVSEIDLPPPMADSAASADWHLQAVPALP